MDEYPFSPTSYPPCALCANLACPEFLYLNLTQWTQGSRKGRYSALLFPCPNVLWVKSIRPYMVSSLRALRNLSERCVFVF